MKIIEKGVVIETDKDGKQRVRELIDIACENKEEAQRVEAAFKTHLDKLLQELEVQELEEKVGRR